MYERNKIIGEKCGQYLFALGLAMTCHILLVARYFQSPMAEYKRILSITRHSLVLSLDVVMAHQILLDLANGCCLWLGHVGEGHGETPFHLLRVAVHQFRWSTCAKSHITAHILRTFQIQMFTLGLYEVTASCVCFNKTSDSIQKYGCYTS